MGIIKDQEDKKAGNEYSNINKYTGNACYRGCHNSFTGNFGQSNHNLYNL